MGQDNGEALAHVGVRLTAQLGDGFWGLVLRFIVEFELLRVGIVLMREHFITFGGTPLQRTRSVLRILLPIQLRVEFLVERGRLCILQSRMMLATLK